MSYVTVHEEDERLTVGIHEQVWHAQRRFFIRYLGFSALLALVVFGAGLIARVQTQPWYVYVFVALFPLFGLYGVTRTNSALRDRDAFRFDQGNGSVWYRDKPLAGQERLRGVRIASGRGWKGWPEVWLVFERHNPVRLLSAPGLALALNMPGGGGPEALMRCKPEATAEVLAAAKRIADHMGVGIVEDGTLRTYPVRPDGTK